MVNLKKSPLAVGLSVTVILAGVLGIHGVAHADSLADDTTTNDSDALANTTLATTDASNSNSNQVVTPESFPSSEPVAVSSPTSNQTVASQPCSTESVPEPSSTLGTLAFGALGTGYMLKRKKQKSVKLDTRFS